MSSRQGSERKGVRDLRAKIIEGSFQWVVPQSEAFASRFYVLLFKTCPEFQALCEGVPRAELHKTLMSLLTLIVQNQRDPIHLIGISQKVGQQWATYGMTATHYVAVRDTFLAALAEVAEDAWSPVLSGAWSTTLDAVKTAMLIGARQTRTIVNGRKEGLTHCLKVSSACR